MKTTLEINGKDIPLFDEHDRPISYLRISITDRCNLRCVYCMPPEGVATKARDQILSYDEIARVVQAAAGLGVRRVRLTGGEPLVRKGLVDLIKAMARIPGIADLSLTTNGVLLARCAEELANAGLHRVNVSLDTLQSDKFPRVTGYAALPQVLAGIEAAIAAGLTPVKINMVVLRGLNDDELLDFARLTLERGWHVRFIELMPIGRWLMANGPWQRNGIVTITEIQEGIEAELGQLEPAAVDVGDGPARYYRLPGARGTIGFIGPVSDSFCHRCNRLRLSADGRLRPCLLSDEETDLRTPLRNGASMDDLKRLIVEAIRRKPERHRLNEGVIPTALAMSQIGG